MFNLPEKDAPAPCGTRRRSLRGPQRPTWDERPACRGRPQTHVLPQGPGPGKRFEVQDIERATRGSRPAAAAPTTTILKLMDRLEERPPCTPRYARYGTDERQISWSDEPEAAAHG